MLSLPRKYLREIACALSGVLLAVVGMIVLAPGTGNAQVACPVNQALLTQLYSGVFHRPVDTGATGFIGRDVNFVVGRLLASLEHNMYSGVFAATKSLEDAQRAPGVLGETERANYLNIIDSALSTVNQWAVGLPEIAQGSGVASASHARDVIQAAYNALPAGAQSDATTGVFHSDKYLGVPANIPLPPAAGY